MSKPESIVEAIKQYFDECPLIKKMGAKTKVEFLKDDTRSFSIETVPGPSVIENTWTAYQSANIVLTWSHVSIIRKRRA